MAESGYPGFEASVWFAMLGPSGMPEDSRAAPATRKRIKALKQADVQTAMSRQGMEAQPEHAARARERASANETATWAALIKKTGIRAE